MSSSSLHRSTSSPHDRVVSTTHTRLQSRPSASSNMSASRGPRSDAGSYSFSASSLSPLTHGNLQMTSYISPSGFARPAYAVNPSLSGAAGGGSPAQAALSRPATRAEQPSAASRRSDSRGAVSPTHRRSLPAPVSRGSHAAGAAAREDRERVLATPSSSSQWRTGTASTSPPHRHRSSKDRDQSAPPPPQRHRGKRDGAGHAAVGIARSPAYVDAAVGGGAGHTLPGSPPSSILTSSTPGIGGMGSGAAVGVMPHHSSTNPLRPPAGGMGDGRADAAVGGMAGAALSIATATAAAAASATAGSPLLPLPASKEHCSHCKAVDEALYLCPCGLARYCGTTCQHAHWSLHRSVCSNAVRTVESTQRRCDWCESTSASLRRCGCGFAFYCDVDCQRADWAYHRLVCSTVASEAIVAALLGGPAPRTIREAATQTAHWQIHVPVLRSQARPEGATDSYAVSGYGSTSLQTSQQCGFTGSDSFGDGRSFADGVSATNGSSYPRSNRTQPPAWEHHSHFQGDSVYTDGTSSTSRSTSAAPLSHVEPSIRHARSSSAVSPRTPSSRLHPPPRPTSVYDSLYLNTSQQELLTPPTAHLRNDSEGGLMTSKTVWAGPQGFLKSTTLSSGIAGLSSRHSYAMSEGDGVDTTGNANGVSPLPSFVSVRDQPSLLAFAATSLRIVESDEQKEWAELCRQFHEARIKIQLRVLPKLEEEQRMAILKEEVMWCVVTGGPAARQLKEQVMRRRRL